MAVIVKRILFFGWIGQRDAGNREQVAGIRLESTLSRCLATMFKVDTMRLN